MSEGNTWPEMDELWEWFKDHEIDVTIGQAIELAEKVTKYRLEIQAERDELYERLDQYQWKPIDQAPKDGTLFLAAFQRDPLSIEFEFARWNATDGKVYKNKKGSGRLGQVLPYQPDAFLKIPEYGFDLDTINKIIKQRRGKNDDPH